MKKTKQQRRRGKRTAATLIRAIVLEGTGIVVLIFLLTLSSSDPARAESTEANRPVLQKIRDWIDVKFSAFGNSNSDPAPSPAELIPPESPGAQYPLTAENEARRFKVKRAMGYEVGNEP